MPLSYEARGVLDEVLSLGRGAVFVTAHLGPIDVMAASVAEHGYSVSTLARESYDPRFTRLYEQLRTPRGVRSIYRGRDAGSKIVRALRGGGLVGFPVDLVGRGVRARTVRFLGQEDLIAVGPIVLANRLNVPIVIGSPAPGKVELEVTVERFLTENREYSYRRSRGGVENGSDEQDLAQSMATILESRVRAIPAHWPWMHKSRVGPGLQDISTCG